MHGFVHAQALDVREREKGVNFCPGICWESRMVSKRTYLASEVGSTNSNNLLKGKPTHGITIDHASTQRIR